MEEGESAAVEVQNNREGGGIAAVGGGGEDSYKEVARRIDGEIGRGNAVAWFRGGGGFPVNELEKPAIDGEI